MVSVISILAVVVALYMAWNIGSNDVANSMASAVGAKAISLRQAVFIASVLNFVGAYFIGSHVTDTVRKGIVNPSLIGEPKLYIAGALAALIAAGLWITIATWKSLPVSTTHAVVGALVGFGMVAGGAKAVNWGKLGQVVASWVISPLFAGVLAYIIFSIIAKFILKKQDSLRAFRKVSPFFIFATFMIIFSSLLLKTHLGEKLSFSTSNSLIMSGGISLTIAFLYFLYIRTRALGEVAEIEKMFRKIQILTSCYVALSQGANDVANAIGPVAGIFSILKTNRIEMHVEVSSFLLALGGVGIMLGILTWGYKVIETVGSKITELNNSRGFTIDFSAATSILIASKLGMPVSTTHAVVGAVIGVGLAHGLEAVDLRVIKKIFSSWILTVPIAAVVTIPIYYFIIWIWR
ncbi:inorganic phosphate transporter [bacterium]|nr:inorganic phosphate transporter [bacterium]